jgi:4-aminobutyrate aminotransferase-like enzyme/Ser/Thr protein kinase RdoA (MazF antagonist)
MSNLAQTPTLTVADAEAIAHQKFGVKPIAPVQPLASERDQNFLLTTGKGQFVLKVSNAEESRESLVAQNEMMQRIVRAGQSTDSKFVQVQPALSGGLIESVESGDKQHFVRLVSFVPGKPMGALTHYSNELLNSLGGTIGRLTEALSGFDHESLHYDFHWDLANAVTVVESRIDLIADARKRQQVETLLDRFKTHTLPLLKDLPQSVIHNDANDGNLIVGTVGDLVIDNRVAGVIDFGDSVWSWTVGELAIGAAYAILNRSDPLEALKPIIKGYLAERSLEEPEVAALFGLICMRLCTSVVMAAEQQAQRPDDPYLSISQAPIARTLPKLVDIPFQFAETWFKELCGFGVLKKSQRVADWLAQQSDFVFPIREERPTDDEMLVIDLGVESPHLRGGKEGISEPAASRAINDAMDAAKAKVVVGRYLEPRLIYQSDLFVAKSHEHEDRTIHLGMDLFDKAGTVVRAPLAGEVFLFHDNNSPLDYGPVIILKHTTDEGDEFYSLYGHLTRSSLENMKVGQTIEAGEVFAKLGAAHENGGWPPHLHLQLIVDLLDQGNDFAGVCRPSRKSVWSQYSPDPNLLMRIPERLFPRPAMEKSAALEKRSRHLGDNLSIGYRKPVKVVRGWKQYLYDENGQRFIDAYNNVPHVGHCHPRVVETLQSQSHRLNTNTRYVSDNILEYAEHLTSTMPSGLDVCYFVNSASEANELALRMARAISGGKDLVVLEGAYHGHSTSLIDISPYKHDGPGGQGSPGWVHTAPVADIYRGAFRDPANAGQSYAKELDVILERIQKAGGQLSGFIAESCPSVGGQIIFPSGYLSNVYRKVRAAGGLCIADDVQTGYGRLGKWFYGFEQQDVVPDIVVLGKPIGNGHPIGAVVTTREIADAFANGMEFFSTFGGNTVSAAVGKTVLEVVQEEGLPAHAEEIGSVLLAGLNELKDRHSLIGDVRGSGLFLGVELVKDRDTLEPASCEASYISNRMRERRILLGTDGPLHNVIKIRPPMPIGLGNAQELLQALGEVLSELK